VENPSENLLFSCYDGVAPQLFLFAKDSGLFFTTLNATFHFFFSEDQICGCLRFLAERKGVFLHQNQARSITTSSGCRLHLCPCMNQPKLQCSFPFALSTPLPSFVAWEDHGQEDAGVFGDDIDGMESTDWNK